MDFQLKTPILLVGVGGVGSKLALRSKELIQSDCLLISNDKNDLEFHDSIMVSTGGVINPTVQLIRGSTYECAEKIRNKISSYSTIIVLSNLAGKSGAAISPVFSQICKEEQKQVLSFAIMPFKFEKDRIFQSGIALKRLREFSTSTIVLDNDALLDSNPDLSPNACHKISNDAISGVIRALNSSTLPEETNILATSKDVQNVEESLKDSLRMLYEDAPPNSIRSSILYVMGGNNVPVGILNSVTNLASGIFNHEHTSVSPEINSAEKSKVILLSGIQGQTHFDSYDPLGVIPQDNTLDWDEPESSIKCNLELYQIE